MVPTQFVKNIFVLLHKIKNTHQLTPTSLSITQCMNKTHIKGLRLYIIAFTLSGVDTNLFFMPGRNKTLVGGALVGKCFLVWGLVGDLRKEENIFYKLCWNHPLYYYYQVNDLVDKIFKGIGKRDATPQDSTSEDSASEDPTSEDLTPQDLKSFFNKILKKLYIYKISIKILV